MITKNSCEVQDDKPPPCQRDMPDNDRPAVGDCHADFRHHFSVGIRQRGMANILNLACGKYCQRDGLCGN